MLLEQQLRVLWRDITSGVAQGHVVLAGVEVGDAVVGIDADVDVGVGGLKGRQAQDQPQRRKGRKGGDVDHAPPACAANLAHGAVQPLQCGDGGGQQGGAVGAELDLARATAQEEVQPISSSRAWIWRLMALCVSDSSSAAARKDRRRATASKARSGPMDSGRWRIGAFMRRWYQSVGAESLDAPRLDLKNPCHSGPSPVTLTEALMHEPQHHSLWAPASRRGPLAWRRLRCRVRWWPAGAGCG